MKTRFTTRALCLLLITGLLGSSFGLTSIQAQTTNGNSGSRPVLIPNSKPYTTEGLKNASGRAGSASISVRALMSKDKSTDVEVTTSEFDSTAPAPGQLTKVQLKTLNQNDEVVYTKNYTNLTGDGTFRTTLTDVQRGQPLQIQTNVRGIDANRTGVVTILDNIKLRPDLQLDRLTVPLDAVLNSLVNITATVTEINNDLGATATCVLYVDGTAVDRAEGITVGKGDMVNCTFTQRFSTTGVRRLKVSVENVLPGDYDTANNYATADVQIVNPEPVINYYASVSERSSEYRNGYDSFWTHANGTFYEQSDYGNYNYITVSKNQSVYFSTSVNRPTAFPINISANETAADGTIVKSIFLANLSPDSESYWFWHGDSDFPYKTVVVQRYQNNIQMRFETIIPLNPENAPYPGYSQLIYNRAEGKVNYYSYNFNRLWNNQQGYVYSYSYNSSSSSGTEQISWGSQVKLESSLGTVNDPVVFSAKPVINLTPSVYLDPNNRPFACSQSSSTNGSETWFNRYCSEYYYRANIMSADVFGSSQQ